MILSELGSPGRTQKNVTPPRSLHPNLKRFLFLWSPNNQFKLIITGKPLGNLLLFFRPLRLLWTHKLYKYYFRPEEKMIKSISNSKRLPPPIRWVNSVCWIQASRLPSRYLSPHLFWFPFNFCLVFLLCQQSKRGSHACYIEKYCSRHKTHLSFSQTSPSLRLPFPETFLGDFLSSLEAVKTFSF